MTLRGSGPDPLPRRRVLRLFAGAALAAGCARAGTAAAPAAALPPDPAVAERQVETDGLSLNVLFAGDGNPPVVLIHGASGNARDFTFGTMAALARQHAVIALDRPGLGASEAPPNGIESPFVQAALLSGALRSLGLRRPILVGHSYGGAVALAWALAEPDALRGLVLLAAPSHVWEGGVGLTSDLLARPILGPALAAVAPFLVSDDFLDTAVSRVFAPQTPPPGYVDRLGRDRLLAASALRTNARQLVALKSHLRAMVPRYASLSLPVELIHGEADTIVPLRVHSEPLVARLPNGRLTRLPGVGHMPHHAAPETLLAAVQRIAAET